MNLPKDSNKPKNAAVSKKKKRPFHFSLASFLLFISVLSGVLGIWLGLVRPTRIQWDTIRHLVERGVRVETSPSKIPGWVKRFLPPGETENVDALFFRNGGRFEPGDLDCLAQLPHLKRLYLERCGVTDKDVEVISKHQPLERLAIWGNEKLTNASAEHLVQLENLQVVDIRSTGINWRACFEFEKRPNLEVKWGDSDVFYAEGDEIDSLANWFPDDVRQLFLTNALEDSIVSATSRFPNLWYINLKNVPPQTIANINALSESLGDKLFIAITDCADVDDEFMDSISQCFFPVEFSSVRALKSALEIRNLRNEGLRLFLCNFSPQFIERFSHHSIIANVPNCEFEDSSIETVHQFAKHFKGAKSLRLAKCNFTSFDAWQGLPALKEISIENCRRLESIRSLSDFGALERLQLSNLPGLDSIEAGTSNGVRSKLKWLELHKLPSFRALKSNHKFESLERITVSACHLMRDVSWMSGLQKLESVEMQDCSLRQVTNLKNLPSLKELKFEYCSSIYKFTDCEFHPKTKLTVSNGRVMQDFGLFENLRGLTKLEISMIKTCKFVERLGDLRILRLRNGAPLESIEGVEKLPSLKVLDLGPTSPRIDENDPVLASLAKTLDSFHSNWPRLLRIFEEQKTRIANEKRSLHNSKK